jgi:hypothetical protein
MSFAYWIWEIERVLRNAQCRKCRHYQNGYCPVWRRTVNRKANCAYYNVNMYTENKRRGED